MASCVVRDWQGKEAGQATLDLKVAKETSANDLMHRAVLRQQAHSRQGTASTLTRAEVRGGGRKPYKQKGTGRARQGSIRAPQFTGGGTVHGPSPRDYTQRTPKKMKTAALRGALSDRARDGRVHVVTTFAPEDVPSTKAAVAALAAVGVEDGCLAVVTRDEEASWLSLRNLPEVMVVAPDQLNTYDVLVSDRVVFTQAAFDVFVSGPASGKGAKAVASESEVGSRAESLHENADRM